MGCAWEEKAASPSSFSGAGVRLFFDLFSFPDARGWRADRRSVRISPDGPRISRAMTHHTDAPASADAL